MNTIYEKINTKTTNIIAILAVILLCLCAFKGCSQTFDFDKMRDSWLKDVTQMSIDPTSNQFIIYFNDKLDISSIRIPGKTLKEMINEPMKDVMYTNDSIFFVAKKTYYKVWIKEVSMVFIVKTTQTGQIPYLGDHLISFINIIRDYRRNRSLSSR